MLDVKIKSKKLNEHIYFIRQRSQNHNVSKILPDSLNYVPFNFK